MPLSLLVVFYFQFSIKILAWEIKLMLLKNDDKSAIKGHYLNQI